MCELSFNQFSRLTKKVRMTIIKVNPTLLKITLEIEFNLFFCQRFHR